MFFTLFHASLLQTKASAAAAGSEVIVTTVKETDEETNNFENLAKIKEIQKDIISLLDSSNVEDNASVEKALDNYFKQHPENQEIFDQYYQKNSRELLPNINEDSEDDIDLNTYLEENIEDGEFQEYQPTDDTKIIFTDTPTFFIENVEEKPVPIDPSDSLIATLAATKKTKSTSNQSGSGANTEERCKEVKSSLVESSLK
ncbi:DUF3627 domain-containing protein [Priestia flexa]|uniref:DUF3627 domain-containing protein n=1 Tax=Priestia flexa TaxID=86664 RepID=UPI0032EB010A